jgi:hypothetical protein
VLIDLGTAVAIRTLGILSHNISYAGTIRIRGFTGSDYATGVQGDTGTVYAYPQTLGVTKASKYPNNWLSCFTADVTARYWKIEIVDTTNAAGYIELGRVWLGEASVVASPVDYGASLIYESLDIKEESLGGVVWGNKRGSRRVFNGAMTNILDTSKSDMLLMQKELGTTSELLFVMNDSADATTMLMESFPAINREISALTFAYFNSNELPLSFQEIV